jgi:hypothetical protein
MPILLKPPRALYSYSSPYYLIKLHRLTILAALLSDGCELRSDRCLCDAEGGAGCQNETSASVLADWRILVCEMASSNETLRPRV